MSILHSKKIQDASTTTLTGNSISVHDAESLVISISGTSTSFTLAFMGSLDGVNYFPVMGDKTSDYNTSSTTTSTLNEAWEFDVSALAKFRANITAIANGNVSVFANSSK